MLGRFHSRRPSGPSLLKRSQQQTCEVGASLQGPCFPISLETSPLPPAPCGSHLLSPEAWSAPPQSPGPRWCSEAASWHHRCSLRTGHTAVSAWAVEPGGPGCGSQSSGGLRQLHPFPGLQVPSIQGDVLATAPAGFLQGPGCDLGRAVVMAPGKDKGRARGTWGSPPLKLEQL